MHLGSPALPHILLPHPPCRTPWAAHPHAAHTTTTTTTMMRGISGLRWALALLVAALLSVLLVRQLAPVYFYEAGTGLLEPVDEWMRWGRASGVCSLAQAGVDTDGALWLHAHDAARLGTDCPLALCPQGQRIQPVSPDLDLQTALGCSAVAAGPTAMWWMDEGHVNLNYFHATYAFMRLYGLLRETGLLSAACAHAEAAAHRSAPCNQTLAVVVINSGGGPFAGPAQWLAKAFTAAPVSFVDLCGGTADGGGGGRRGPLCFGQTSLGRSATGRLYWRARQAPEAFPETAATVRGFGDAMLRHHGLPPAAESPRPSAADVIFILRRRTQRRILNDADLQTQWAAPSCASVRFVYLEDMSYAEQLAVARNGTAVFVGAHGAGLTNLLYLPTGAYVIELLSRSYPYLRLYGNLAELAGMHHRPFYYEPWTPPGPAAAPDHGDPSSVERDRPFMVDVAALCLAINDACRAWVQDHPVVQ